MSVVSPFNRADVVEFLFATLIFTMLVVPPVCADQTDAKSVDLFRQLQSAQELEQAQFIENRIWDMWHTHTDPQVDNTMAIGVLSMQHGPLRKSLATFDKVVAIAPNFSAGWNIKGDNLIYDGPLRGFR